jgi:hypothetical protein
MQENILFFVIRFSVVRFSLYLSIRWTKDELRGTFSIQLEGRRTNSERRLSGKRLNSVDESLLRLIKYDNSKYH